MDNALKQTFVQCKESLFAKCLREDVHRAFLAETVQILDRFCVFREYIELTNMPSVHHRATVSSHSLKLSDLATH